MFCVNCGTQMPDGAKFCPKCGNRTAPANTETSASVNGAGAARPAPAVETVAAAAATTATAATAATTAASGASTAGIVAGAAAVGAVKKTASAGKKLAIFGVILALILTVFTAYFTYFVETPDEVVEKFFDCYANADINGMMECVEPSVGTQVNSMLGIGSSLLDIAGIGIDLTDLIGLAPMFSDYLGIADYNPGNFEVVSYSGDKLTGFVEQFGHKWIAVGNAIGEEAIVECDIDNIRGGAVTGIDSDAARVRVRIRVINCGDDGWRLPGDVTPEYVRDVY